MENNNGKVSKKYLINFFFQKVPNKKHFAKKIPNKILLFQRVPSNIFLQLTVKYNS